jgi:tetratricopeptide (TPR) repeat protein
VEIIRFTFWESVGGLALVLMALLSAKAVASLPPQWSRAKPLLYVVILSLAVVGSWNVGNDVAAEVYMWSCDSSLRHGDVAKGYSNALRAVTLRPANGRYWRALINSKIRLQQIESALDDEPALRALSGDKLDEVDNYEFALCHFFTGQYDPVIATTTHLIQQNRSYAAPYVLQGLAYTAEKKYPEAEQSFLQVLDMFPSNQAAVEGLARAYFLSGDRRGALGVLDTTAKFPFPVEIRERFEALKGLYGQ